MASRVPRTRNGGKLTEAAYWSRIRSALRKTFAAWEPATQAMKNARRDYVGINKRQKFEVMCASCHSYFPMKEIQKDHIVAVGSLKCGDDLKGFVERLTPEDPAAFQMLCHECHQMKTNKAKTKGA